MELSLKDSIGNNNLHVSYSTLYLYKTDQTVTSIEYNRISRSENNILDLFYGDTQRVSQDDKWSKLLKDTSSGVILNQNKHQETRLPQVSRSSFKIGLTGADLNSIDLKSDCSRLDMKIFKTKYLIYLETVVSQMASMSFEEKIDTLESIYMVMQDAWSVPIYGHELGYSLCNFVRISGGLSMLLQNCRENDNNLQFLSARLLEKCLTKENTGYVVDNALENVVKLAVAYSKNTNTNHSRVGTGILEHLFKQNERTCYDVIRLGGLDAILFECRINDLETLRTCARSLANLSLYGGAENQEAMISKQVPMWLFPLAFHHDDNIKYYACLAIAVLVANKEIEAKVLESGTLELVEPFVTSHDPSEFAKSNLANVDGQAKEWLERLVSVLSSNREEAVYLAAFHFCMEAGIKKEQGKTKIFNEIGAIEPLKTVASCPNALASKFAAQALRLIGEPVPHKLSQQVPLWSVEDVQEWVNRVGFGEFRHQFVESHVDGDMLLRLNEQNLQEDIGISNGIQRLHFARELQNLKKIADYSSKDNVKMHQFLNKIGPEYCVYTYDMLNAGIDRFPLRKWNEKILKNECGVSSTIHRQVILHAFESLRNSWTSELEASMDKPLDAFVSYRRSSGSQLASLLKVHLTLRGFSVFIDVEKLEAGKFDSNLLDSIRQAKHFILVLTSDALERCVDDYECKDWVHKEIVTALNSNCNIIPIVDNFSWPETERLPKDMRSICYFNAVTWIHDYQDACIEKVERFMCGESKAGLFVSEKTKINGCDNGYESLRRKINKKANDSTTIQASFSHDDILNCNASGHSMRPISKCETTEYIKRRISFQNFKRVGFSHAPSSQISASSHTVAHEHVGSENKSLPLQPTTPTGLSSEGSQFCKAEPTEPNQTTDLKNTCKFSKIREKFFFSTRK